MSSAESRPYHLNQRGENLGQFTREEILAQLASGQLQPNALCWRLGMDQWRPISTLQDPESAAPEPVFPPAKEEPVFPAPAADPVFPSAPAAAPEPVFSTPAPEPVFSAPATEPDLPSPTVAKPVPVRKAQLPDAPDPALLSQTPARPAAPRQGPPPLPPRQPRAAGTPPPVPPRQPRAAGTPPPVPPRQPRAAGTPPPLPPRPTPPTGSSPQPVPAPQPDPKTSLPAQPRKKINSRYYYAAAAAAALLLIGSGIWYWVQTKPERAYQKAQLIRATGSPEDLVRQLRVAEDLGHAQAMVELATCYRLGLGTPRDLTRAYQLNLQAAKLGNSNGQLQTGLCLAEGIGTLIDNPQAIQWLERAAGNGHPDGPYHIAAYFFDQANPDLHKKGIRLLQEASNQGHLTAQGHYQWYLHQQQPSLDTLRSLMKAAEAGDALSQYFYAQTFLNHEGRITDVPAYNAWLEKAAAQHLPRALIALGDLYDSGLIENHGRAEALDYYNQALQLGSLQAHLRIGRLQLLSKSGDQTLRTALDHYHSAAESGLPDGQYRLGYLYETGVYLPKDFKQAKKWYEAAADGGSASAKIALGSMSEHGRGVPKDLNLAYLYYKSAAAQDDPEGYYELSRCQLSGIGIAEDQAAGLKNLQKAAEKNNPTGLYSLGFAYEFGLYGLSQDLSQAYAHIQKAANLGLAAAQYRLAYWYSEGKYLAQDKTKFIEWLQKAADQNHGPALLYLSHLYKQGTYFTADAAQYQTYLRSAADQKYPPAMTELALAILSKQEGFQDSSEEAAALLLLESANLNEPEACYRMGLSYIETERQQQFTLAIPWLTKAAEKGHLVAQITLADIHTYGSNRYTREKYPFPPRFLFDNDIQPNPQEAFRWRHLAAEQGNPASQCLLGQAYLYGEGTDVNLPESITWLKKAVEQKAPDALFYLGVAQHHIKNPQESTEAFRQGAELGDPECQYEYANSLYEGRGTPADPKKALIWMEKSARQGLMEAIITLYDWNNSGTPTAKSIAEANRWLDVAAAGGAAAAQTQLAINLISGEQQRKQDLPTAIDLLKKATAQNNAYAYYILGVCYNFGKGVPKDLTRAQEYFQKAAERGNQAGQYYLALRLIANAQDNDTAALVEAYKWIKLANLETDEARNTLATVSKALTPQQIAQADQSLADFTPISDETKAPAYISGALLPP